jgi:hypothetical protein
VSAEPYGVLRERFRPKQTRVLLIGESRPANGSFFFAGDSKLARHAREAFEVEYGPFPDVATFLRCFQSLGCYLIDLCPTPVNHLSRAERKRERRNGEPMLAHALGELKPHALIVVMKAIAPLSGVW